MQTAWFAILISSICLEGLGRRYLPFVPQATFYFLKDVVLLFGYLQFRPSREVVDTAKSLYRGFGIVWAAAFGWTVLEMLNPASQSFLLAFIGMRSYWLWWIAPLVIASALQNTRQKERAIYLFLILVTGVALLAAIQFASPADSNINMYAVWNGEEIHSSEIATVASTGRARVSSTFAFISGFVDFTLLVPALLLSFGVDSKNPMVRNSALLGTFLAAAVVPMSGSRSSIVIGIAILCLTLWTAGLFFTRVGRRVFLGAIIASVVSVVAFPEAFSGVQSRFEANEEETNGRFEDLANLLPPVALAVYDYPTAGIGTGMQQNARATFRIATEWDAEGEVPRYLVELGPVGFCAVWAAKLGLMVALLRSYQILKNAGRRGSAATALSYSALTMIGNLTFDHNWQALYFVGCGFVLSEVVAVQRQAVGDLTGAGDAETSGSRGLAPRAA